MLYSKLTDIIATVVSGYSAKTKDLTTGLYRSSDWTDYPSELPDGQGYVLMVVYNTNWRHHYYFSPHYGTVFECTINGTNASWSSWTKVPKMEDLDKKVVTGTIANLQSIELKAANPYIDFHFNNDGRDYTSRIIESSSGTLQLSQNLWVISRINSDIMEANTIKGDEISSPSIKCNGRVAITRVDDEHYIGFQWKLTGSSIPNESGLYVQIDDTLIGPIIKYTGQTKK